MKYKHQFIPSILVAALAFIGFVPFGRANVFPSNIRINGAATNAVSLAAGSSATISYLLNEAASGGVAITISSSTGGVRTISIPSGAGTLKGTNAVLWNLKDNNGNPVGSDNYSVSITAAANGYSGWTQISNDGSPSSYCNRPRGIAVDNNTNSPYYGRIIIGNSQVGPGAATNGWGDVPGFYKVNADGSYSDDGAGRFGTAGYNFSDVDHYDGGNNPISMKIREDDRLYWDNWVGDGEIVACDVSLTTNQIVMPESAYTSNPFYPGDNWKSFEVTDVLTSHARLYLTDDNSPSAGIWYWPMKNGIADPSDPNYLSGYQALSTSGDLPRRCDGVAIDANTNVYAIENPINSSDPRAVCFTNWNGTSVLTNGASWSVGSGDDSFLNLYNLALDSVQNPRYLAVSMSSLSAISGGIRILSATNGSTVVANLNPAATYFGVCWDRAGNLYGGSQSAQKWRVFSPPGTNQATTVALATIHVAGAIQITSISVSGNTVTIKFTSDAADLAAAFTLQSSSAVGSGYADTSASITQTGPGAFQATTSVSGPAEFYRLRK